MSHPRGELAFISVTSSGHVVVAGVKERQNQMAAIGLPDHLTLAPTPATELDVRGRLKLPERIASYLRSGRP